MGQSDRVEGRVAPAVLPHHRAYGSVAGPVEDLHLQVDAPCRAHQIGIGAIRIPDRAPPTPPGMRVRTGRFEKLRS
ncbi:MAG: hypothetical protein COW89_08640 [Nitrospinae bacterium CG22_combo_CG10-13_8_21_14_all_47_10]|nr:MAG: hypothetical protein COW89_08640 [Nitrospinae bacterium CG22_combo_CG10-13_8_21_14_all_47_10]